MTETVVVPPWLWLTAQITCVAAMIVLWLLIRWYGRWYYSEGRLRRLTPEQIEQMLTNRMDAEHWSPFVVVCLGLLIMLVWLVWPAVSND